MPFDPALADAISRARFNVGDTATAELLPDTTYQAVLDINTSGDPAVTDEAAATRDIARALAAKYAVKPSQVRLVSGLSVTWERVQQWNLIAQGLAGGASTGRGKGFTLKRGPAVDYTTGEGDASE
jgi:hypothetical protein